MLLTHTQLAEWRSMLQDQLVLSVYLTHAADNPADRIMRQSALVNALAQVRGTLAHQSKSERAAFEHSVEHLGDAMDGALHDAHGLGWAGFVTPNGVQFAGSLHAPLPTLVRWQRGIWATPCMRALNEHRAVIVAVVDGISAHLYRYVAGTLTTIAKLDVHPRGGHADHLGALPRAGFHPGTRGTSAADLAARGRVTARDRVVDATAARVAELAGHQGYVIVGGNAAAVHALWRALPAPLAARTLMLPELTAKASEAEIRELAATGLSQLRNADDLALVARVVENVGAHGAAVAGRSATLEALAAGRVHEVLLTERFVAEHTLDAERAVDLALDHATTVEIVAGSGASQLDRSAGGIAAQLRFVPRPAAPLGAAS